MKIELQPAQAVKQVKRSTTFRVAARSGFVVSGLLHVLIGYISIRLAFGASGQADVSGAVSQVALDPAGLVLLWLGGIACLALFLWHLGSAVLERGQRVAQRISALAQGVVFGVLTYTFVAFALGAGTNSRESTSDWTASVLKWPYGQLVLIGAGGVVGIVGVVFIVRGLARSFRKQLRMPHSSTAGATITVLGVAGFVAKGIVLLLVGLLFVMASIQVQPQQSTGIDGALKGLRSQPYGTYVLAFVGGGLICYGLYLVIKARFASMES